MRKYILFLFLLLLLFTSLLHAQSVQWARKGGGISTDVGKNIAADPSGNSYVVGTFQNTVTFGSYSITGPSVATNSFIAKYDDLGNIQWLRQVSGTNNNALYAVTYCVAQNCIYVGGRFAGTINIGPIVLISSGGNDCFFAKYDLSGNCIWAIKAGSINGEEVNDIDCDLSGNLLATGWALSGSQFGPFIVPVHPLTQAFTTSISPSEVFQWLTMSCYTAGSSSTTAYPVIKADRFANVFVSGLYSQTCVFGSQTFTGQGISVNTNVYLQKINSIGNILWTITIGGTQPVDVYGISTDASGNVYITGSFRGTADFGGILMTAPGGVTNNDCYLAKYNTNGVLQWANQYGSTNVDIGRSVEVFSNGNILLSGYYSTITQIGAFSFNGTGFDAFVAICNPSGIPIWVESYGGSLADYMNCAVTNNTSIYATGYFSGTASNYGSFQLATAGNMDVSIIKISQPNPLPVELISFTAKIVNTKSAVTCDWMSASEMNNDFYLLEKSEDGKLFVPITTVPAQQNNANYKSYTYRDENPFTGISYYRLSQTDLDGKSEILKTVAVRLDKPNDQNFICYLINANNDLFVSSESSVDAMKIFDTNGRLVQAKKYTTNTFQVVLPLAALEKGIYFIQLFSAGEQATRKIVVL